MPEDVDAEAWCDVVIVGDSDSMEKGMVAVAGLPGPALARTSVHASRLGTLRCSRNACLRIPLRWLTPRAVAVSTERVMRNRWAITALVGSICVAAPAAQQQSTPPAPLPPFVAQPIPLYKVGLGSFSRKTSSSNTEAQAYFDQGFQLMYSFAKYEAIRSFREAWKRDPGCAICYWGEAWAWGTSLNQVISAADAPFAYAAAQKALRLA